MTNDKMYRISPIQTKEEQELTCNKLGCEYDADMMAYSAKTEDGELLGVCQFIIKNDTGYIKELVSSTVIEDYEAVFIMARAALNFMDLCGAKCAIYNGEEKPIVRALGFKSDENGRLTIDLEGFFEHKCGGK